MSAHPNPAKAVECVREVLARDWSGVVNTDEFRAGYARAVDDVEQALADAADGRVFPVAEDLNEKALMQIMRLHVRSRFNNTDCACCRRRWPCETWRLASGATA